MTPGVTVNQSMDERIKEFRNDPEKMDVTTKFVNEVVEKAKDEALKRMMEKEKEKKRKSDGDRETAGSEEDGKPEPEVSSQGCLHLYASAVQKLKSRVDVYTAGSVNSEDNVVSGFPYKSLTVYNIYSVMYFILWYAIKMASVLY